MYDVPQRSPSAMQIDEQDALNRLIERDTEEAATTLSQDNGLSSAKVCMLCLDPGANSSASKVAMRFDHDCLWVTCGHGS